MTRHGDDIVFSIFTESSVKFLIEVYYTLMDSPPYHVM